MVKQAIKKGAGVKKSGLAAFKEKKGMIYQHGSSQASNNADKPIEWILMPEAFQEATKLPGIPQGYVTLVMGHSNVGKSTLINHAMVSAQKQGLIPVFFDTENAFSFQYAVQMGLKAEPVYDDVEVEEVNPETGEVTTHMENQIVNWEGDFLYYNSKTLADQYGQWDYSQGKEVSKKRKDAVLEDIAMCISDLMEEQETGGIDQGFLFIWDSIGSIGCYKEYASAKLLGNNMWAANAISVAFNKIFNDKIPSSKKTSSKYTNTMILVNKVWMDNQSNPVGPAIMTAKGGKSGTYASRLCLVLGGSLTAGVKRLTATAKGANYSYGIETKIKVTKNHLDAPHNVCYEGKMVACDVGFISPDKLEDYKKNHISQILKQLQEVGGNDKITADDITFGEVEDND